MWNELTELAEKKRAIAVIGKLEGEPRNLAKTLKRSELCTDDGLKKLLDLLEKSFESSSKDRVDRYLMELLDWAIEDKSLDHFLSGFITRMERIKESLKIPSKLQGMSLLRQANLSGEQRGRILACTGGSIEINDIIPALKNTNFIICGTRGDKHEIGCISTTTGNKGHNHGRNQKNSKTKLCKFCRKKLHNFLKKDFFKQKKVMAHNEEGQDCHESKKKNTRKRRRSFC